ncbi:MAG: sensor histidine kinase, partial [Cellulosilyticaceae bacterium]
PPFIEGEVFYQVLRESSKSMHERINAYEKMQLDYKEYIEGWIHEIKTPIAGIKLITENNDAPELSKVAEEMKKIEGFVEQALYYARSNDVQKDYIIKPFSIRQAVMEVLKNNSRLMIQKGIFPAMEGLDEVVYSDYKWLVFILNQLVSNSIKYTEKSKSTLKIEAVKMPHKIVLTLADEGVGIDEKELSKVCDKGFTGEKGRKYREATGMGLYLSKKLCEKLGVGMEIQSTLGVGTTVSLIFPLSRLEAE